MTKLDDIHLNRSSNYRTAGLARARDGSISWMDESALDFENWADGEPNSVEGDGEDCVQMYTQVEAVRIYLHISITLYLHRSITLYLHTRTGVWASGMMRGAPSCWSTSA